MMSAARIEYTLLYSLPAVGELANETLFQVCLVLPSVGVSASVTEMKALLLVVFVQPSISNSITKGAFGQMDAVQSTFIATWPSCSVSFLSHLQAGKNLSLCVSWKSPDSSAG